jgi:hypothetical protein
MRQKAGTPKPSAEKVIKDTRRVTRKQWRGGEDPHRAGRIARRGVDRRPVPARRNRGRNHNVRQRSRNAIAPDGDPTDVTDCKKTRRSIGSIILGSFCLNLKKMQCSVAFSIKT